MEFMLQHREGGHGNVTVVQVSGEEAETPFASVSWDLPSVDMSIGGQRRPRQPTTHLDTDFEGCPRITFEDGAHHFAVSLRMICTPGQGSILNLVSHTGRYEGQRD